MTTMFEIEGDLALSADGKTTLPVRGAERVLQWIKARMQIVQGTYPYDESEGARWLSILGEPYSEGLLRAELIRIALQDPEIARAEVLTIGYDRPKRKATASMRVYFADQSSEDLRVEL